MPGDGYREMGLARARWASQVKPAVGMLRESFCRAQGIL